MRVAVLLAFCSCAALKPSFTHYESGAVTTLEDLRGHVVVLNYWAEWCTPCIAEFPALGEVVVRAGPKVVLIAAYSGDAPAPGAKLLRWLDQQPSWFRSRVYWATRLALFQAESDVIPTTIVFDTSGKQIARFAGSILGREAELVDAITGASKAE